MNFNSNIDLKQLRYFVAVIDAGSISKASRLCNIAQPALSKRIANLEFGLKVTLLHRGPGGIQATEQGMLLYQAAQRVLRDMEHVIDQVHAADENPTGEVRVGCLHSLTRLLAPPLAIKVSNDYPNVRLSVGAGQTKDIYRSLIDGLIDVGIMVFDEEADNLDIDMRLDEELFIVAGPTLPGLPEQECIDRAVLADIPFIFPTAKTFASGQYTIDFFRRHGIELNVVAEIDGDAIKILMASGYGACILPESFVAGNVESGSLCLKRLKDMPLSRTIVLCVAEGRPRTLAARAIAHELQQIILDKIESGEWKHAALCA
ncbi:LysR family transcriptional regulator [uncultured Parasphingorhabdus sp.]|uniref:LysR family transcriptional regulator n=1 Tax=uncultured Parasphingorhabdus sp. TaxID=2709694 RepID=UPI0030D71C91|tara:strand:- start:6058 stop:7008 length:951 start_codon:yes stop_codon:yes gene_type:complete